MRSARWIVAVAALGTAACHGDGTPVDADGDGVDARFDCDDSNAAVYSTVTAYPDDDGDGIGAGVARSFCTGGGVPVGYTVAGADCAPGDPAKWRTVVDPPVDRDADGYTAHEGAVLCVGAVLPEPYLAADRGVDCDDSDGAVYRWLTLYGDRDGDGVGARPRSAAWTCIGASLPTGFSALGYDIDDLDAMVAEEPAADDDLALILD